MINAIVVTNEFGEIRATPFEGDTLFKVANLLLHLDLDFQFGEITDDGRIIIYPDYLEYYILEGGN